MATCTFFPDELTEGTKAEHILLNALAVAKRPVALIAPTATVFGSAIDDEVSKQVAVLRNMLHLGSGSGRMPPVLKHSIRGRYPQSHE